MTQLGLLGRARRDEGNHAIYKPSNSSSKIPGARFQVPYVRTSAGGEVYRDYVEVAGVTAPSIAVGAASHVSPEFHQEPIDGLMGLAFSSGNTVRPGPQLTFFDTVKAQLDQPLFAVALKHGAPGVFDFGYTDNQKYKGDITYTDVDSSEGSWQFQADAYTIGNGQPTQRSLSGVAGK